MRLQSYLPYNNLYWIRNKQYSVFRLAAIQWSTLYTTPVLYLKWFSIQYIYCYLEQFFLGFSSTLSSHFSWVPWLFLQSLLQREPPNKSLTSRFREGAKKELRYSGSETKAKITIWIGHWDLLLTTYSRTLFYQLFNYFNLHSESILWTFSCLQAYLCFPTNFLFTIYFL